MAPAKLSQPPREEITTEYDQGAVQNVMLHDGSWVRLRKIAADYDATDRDRAYAHIRDRQAAGEVATGLLFLSTDAQDMLDQNAVVPEALTNLPFEQLCPGSAGQGRLPFSFSTE